MKGYQKAKRAWVDAVADREEHEFDTDHECSSCSAASYTGRECPILAGLNAEENSREEKMDGLVSRLEWSLEMALEVNMELRGQRAREWRANAQEILKLVDGED
jgi:hypothetical protein